MTKPEAAERLIRQNPILDNLLDIFDKPSSHRQMLVRLVWSEARNGGEFGGRRPESRTREEAETLVIACVAT